MPLSRWTRSTRRACGAGAALAAVAVVTGSVLLVAARPLAAVQCIDTVRYQGKLYDGTFVGKPLRKGAQLHATRPGCSDSSGASVPAAGVTVAKVVGVSPSLALLAANDRRHVYLVSGVFPENPDHPLHIALYGNRARPNECLGAHALGSTHVRGTVTETPLAFNLLQVRSATRVTSLTIDAWTRLRFPVTRRLLKGARVDVTAVRCLRPNTTSPVLVARRIDLA